MLEHADGPLGTFQIYERYHEKLRSADGWYAFTPYRNSRKPKLAIDCVFG